MRMCAVLVPSLSLLSQTVREWTSNVASPFKWIAVCSDPSVEEDDLVEHTLELGFPTTTSPAKITAVLGSAGPCVVFATYQSSPRIAEACGLGAGLRSRHRRRGTPLCGSDRLIVRDDRRCRVDTRETSPVHDSDTPLLHGPSEASGGGRRS